jgi:serine/threonine protein kinase
MSDPNQLVLHEDAQIIPMSDVSEKVRRRLSTTNGSHVLSRPGSRNGSMVIDEQGAKLVQLLAEGLLLTDALRRLAAESALSPDAVAQGAYPLIKALIGKHYLKKKEQTEKPRSTGGFRFTFRPHDIFQGHTIERTIQVLEDTEIYQIRLKQGGTAALKLLRESPDTVHEAFKREALILQKISGGITPKLIEAQLEGDTKFLIMEWISGMQSHLWAARLSNLSPKERHAETLHMCREIVRAYLHLHQQGVLHSDIYPKNVLICPDGTARIIDFGYSFHDEVDAIVGKSRRNCNTYYKSPDLAQAELLNVRTRTLPPSVSSDMYSIGALLYFLVTGATYVDFSLQDSEVFRQICEAPPVPFAQRGVDGFEQLEHIIFKMLAKDPSERYASLEQCLEDLGHVQEMQTPARPSSRILSLEDVPLLRSLATNTAPTPFLAPSASLNFGGAGVAYALLKASHALEDQSLVPAADIWACHSRIWMESGSDGSLCPKMGITEKAVGPYSSLHRIEGVTLVEALIAHSQLDSLSLRRHCLSFLSGIHKKEAPLEFVSGKAGMLNTIHQLSLLVEENQPLIQVGREVVADMMHEIGSLTKLDQSSVSYLGFAHGWAGIFYSLLAWGRKYDPEVVGRTVPLLHQLAGYAITTRIGSHWPYRFDQPAETGDMASWCNGTAGFILLWSEAYLATGDSQWLSLARRAARHCMTYIENLNSLCCGLAGRAYALAILGSVSGEDEWFDAAEQCLRRKSGGTPDVAQHHHSLFKGVLGHELARLEVSKRDGISFPTLASDMYGGPIPVGALP